MTDLQRYLAAALGAFTVSSMVVLALFVGGCVFLHFLKVKSRRGALVVRNLDERLGVPPVYLPPSTIRHGRPVDQLKTPELLEAQGRKTA
jgi:hypothetical protein